MDVPLRLAAVAPPGLAGVAARRLLLLSSSTGDRVVLALLVVGPLLVVALGGSRWWLVLVLLALASVVVRYLRGAAFARRALGPGAPVVASWGADAVLVERRTGEVGYDYRSLRLSGRERGLVTVRVDTLLRPRPLWLLLPEAVVPEDAGSLLARAGEPTTDLEHRAVVPADFGRHLTRDVWRHSSRRAVAPLLLGFILVDSAVLVALGAWPLAVPAVGFVLLVATGWRRAARVSLRRRPTGSVVGAEVRRASLLLDSAQGRAEVPLARLRNVDAVGPRHVMLVLRGPQSLVVLPRAVLPDAVVGELRRAIGRPPLLARQRLG